MKAIIVGIVMFGILTLAFAVPQSISHQGRLLQDGILVEGSKTINFAIYDSLTDGGVLWSTSNVTVQVRQGIYSVELGSASNPITPGLLDGDSAYLEITIDPSGANDVLSPRTKFTSVAYALQVGAMNASGLSGTIDQARLPSSFELSGTITANAFVGDGSLLTGITGGDIAFGSDSGPTNSIFVKSDGLVGIGTTNPTHKLEIVRSAGVEEGISVSGNTAGGAGYVGLRMRLNSIVDSVVRNRISPGETYTGLEIGTTSNHHMRFITNGAEATNERMRITSAGNVGIGTTNPGKRLYVEGEIPILF